MVATFVVLCFSTLISFEYLFLQLGLEGLLNYCFSDLILQTLLHSLLLKSFFDYLDLVDHLYLVTGTAELRDVALELRLVERWGLEALDVFDILLL